MILSDKDTKVLESGWLTDEHMLIFSKKDYPSVDGLQDTLLQQNFSWDIPSSEFVVNGNHWITISNIGLSDSSVHKDKVKINIMNAQQRENESDCGVFAIAFAKCVRRKGTDFVNPGEHLAQYLPEGIIPEFPMY